MTLAQLHRAGVLVWALVAVNLLLAAWAGAAMLRRRRALPTAFWATLLVSLILLAVQYIPGLFLLALGLRPRTPLHLLYGVLVLIGALVQYGLRPRAALRRLLPGGPGALNEPRVMGLLCLTQAALLMRAWMTAALGR